MDLCGRMNRGKWSPLSWKTAFSTTLFQGAFLQNVFICQTILSMPCSTQRK